MFGFLAECFGWFLFFGICLIMFKVLFGDLAIGKNSSKMKRYKRDATIYTKQRLKNGAGIPSKQELIEHTNKYRRK